jgi:hypothetical protein
LEHQITVSAYGCVKPGQCIVYTYLLVYLPLPYQHWQAHRRMENGSGQLAYASAVSHDVTADFRTADNNFPCFTIFSG